MEPFKDKSIEYYNRFGDIVYEKIVPGIGVVRVYDPDDIEFVYRNEGEHPKRIQLEMVVQVCKDRNLPLGLANQ